MRQIDRRIFRLSFIAIGAAVTAIAVTAMLPGGSVVPKAASADAAARPWARTQRRLDWLGIRFERTVRRSGCQRD